MELFESPLAALRYIKGESKNLDVLDSLYLVYGDFPMTFLVCEHDFEVGEYIKQDWEDSGHDLHPEDQAEEYTVWQYISKDKFELYGSTKDRPALMKTSEPLYRRKINVRAVETVQFLID